MLGDDGYEEGCVGVGWGFSGGRGEGIKLVLGDGETEGGREGGKRKEEGREDERWDGGGKGGRGR